MAGPARSTATERRRWRLLTILTQHGLSPNVAQAVLALGAQLRDETFRTKAERAAVLDVETGAPWAKWSPARRIALSQACY